MNIIFEGFFHLSLTAMPQLLFRKNKINLCENIFKDLNF